MNDVLNFWFETLTPKQWFKNSASLDAQIQAKFEKTFNEVVAGETASWRDSAQGRLAEVIVLDQFTRNMFRNNAKAFRYDSLALALAQEAVRGGHDKTLPDSQRVFLYMPYMHSESRKVHLDAMLLFKDLPNLDHEIRHKEIIDTFGRYPHRNEMLGRESTVEELEFLKTNKGF